MKNALLIFALFLGFAASAQETKIIEPDKTWVTTCIPRALHVEIPVVFSADAYYRTQLRKPIGEFNSLQNWALSKELPFMHTITGSVYTFDFIRYTVRQ
jgi:hypothetical protein